MFLSCEIKIRNLIKMVYYLSNFPGEAPAKETGSRAERHPGPRIDRRGVKVVRHCRRSRCMCQCKHNRGSG